MRVSGFSSSDVSHILRAGKQFLGTPRRYADLTRRIDDLTSILGRQNIEDRDEVLLTLEQVRLESQKRNPDGKTIAARLGEILGVIKAVPGIADAIREIRSIVDLLS